MSMQNEIDNLNITATYSAEDNAIRIYCDERYSPELFGAIREAGFKWFPKQELFCVKRWTPRHAQYAEKLAGAPLIPEQTTIAERAEAKAIRLDLLREKRLQKAQQESDIAHSMSDGVNQPVLAGHHSQRKIEKTRNSIERAQERVAQHIDTANYWAYKAEGVERYANMKGDPRVISNRINKLLKELRDFQKRINEANNYADVFERVATKGLPHNDKFESPLEHLQKWLEYNCGYGVSEKLRDDAKELLASDPTMEQLNAFILEWADKYRASASSQTYKQWIAHILGRIGFEQSRLPTVPRYEGDLTAAIVQAFFRTHGANKPKAKCNGGEWRISSNIQLPVHLTEGENDVRQLVLTGNELCGLMYDLGYLVPAPKAKQPPILNFKCETLNGRGYMGKIKTYKQIGMTKKQYADIYKDSRGVFVSECQTFKFKYAPDPSHTGPYYSCPRVAVFIVDSKTHNAPQSVAIDTPTVKDHD